MKSNDKLLRGFLRQKPFTDLSVDEQIAILLAWPSLDAKDLTLPPALQQLLMPLKHNSPASWFMEKELEEVFGILLAAQLHSPGDVNGTIIAYAAKRLVACESQTGGPYMTRHSTIELLPNARIAWSLQLLEAPLPKLLAYIRDQVDTWVSQRPAVLSERQYLALQSVAALDDQAITKGVRKIISALKPPEVDSLAAVLHSAVIARLQSAEASASYSDPRHQHQAALHDMVYIGCQELLRRVPQLLRPAASQMVERVRRADANKEIALLPAFFADSWARPTKLQTAQLTQPQICQLGQANVFAWIAYVIYDDLIDDEGQAHQLPVANMAQRMSSALYRQLLPDDNAFQMLAQATFDGVDAANAWELAHCRWSATPEHVTVASLPQFGALDFLAERTLIHGLGPLAVLCLRGVSPTSALWQHVEAGLRHYLIARQLNDDLLDCFTDLAAGHITPVVAMVCRRARLQPATYYTTHLIRHLRPVFREAVLPDAVAIAQTHIKQARTAWRAVSLQEGSSLFGLVDAIDDTLQRALQQRQQGQDFLQAFEED